MNHFNYIVSLESISLESMSEEEEEEEEEEDEINEGTTISTTCDTQQFMTHYVNNCSQIKILQKYYGREMESKIDESYDEALLYLENYLERIKDTDEYKKINKNNFSKQLNIQYDELLVDIVIMKMIEILQKNIIYRPSNDFI